MVILFRLDLVLLRINHCRLFNAKSFLYIYIIYMISKHIFDNIFKRAWADFCKHLNGFTCSCQISIILFIINYFFVDRLNIIKYHYLTLTIQLHVSRLFTQINDLIVLFQTILFSMCDLFFFTLNVKSHCLNIKQFYKSIIRTLSVLYFDLRPGPKILFQGDTPEGSDTFQWPVIERDHVGGLRLMIWDKMKVPLWHYSDAPEENNLWTAWQLFPFDDD